MIVGQDQGKNWDGEAGQPRQCKTEKQSSKSKERAEIALSAVLKTVPAYEIFQPPSQTKYHHRQGNQPKERWKRAESRANPAWTEESTTDENTSICWSIINRWRESI